MSYLWYHFMLNVARVAYWCIGGVKGVDESNVPRKGPLIVAPLHVSHLDPPAVACGTNRHMRFMAKEELFHHKAFGWLIRSLGAFPVKRGEQDTESIRAAIHMLENGEAVLIFPEGTRGDGKHIQSISRGVAMLAKRTGVPVMPVGIVGTHIAWPRGQKKIKRSKMKIVYGEPFRYADVACSAGEKENREIFARELQRRIVQLCASQGLVLEPSNEA
jgi:1-acyl-sn-glycerol-3-phosphate acyltransferase